MHMQIHLKFVLTFIPFMVANLDWLRITLCTGRNKTEYRTVVIFAPNSVCHCPAWCVDVAQ